MSDAATPLHRTIAQDVMLYRLAQSEQMREFFVQMWLQNPDMARRAGRRVQDLVSPLRPAEKFARENAMSDLGIAEDNPGLASLAKTRLDAEEIAALTEALRGVSGEVWLFGSRADPTRRGGDIDILVLTDQPAFETSHAIATRFFSRCEEKIDVIVLDPAHLSPDKSDFLARINRVRIA